MKKLKLKQACLKILQACFFLFLLLSFGWIVTTAVDRGEKKDKKQIIQSISPDCISNAEIAYNQDAEKIILSNIKGYTTKCSGLNFLIYDWPGRPMKVCIPVLKNDMLVPCSGE